jgi:hypothetical protein
MIIDERIGEASGLPVQAEKDMTRIESCLPILTRRSEKENSNILRPPEKEWWGGSKHKSHFTFKR